MSVLGMIRVIQTDRLLTNDIADQMVNGAMEAMPLIGIEAFVILLALKDEASEESSRFRRNICLDMAT
jgi:hypothetical protein